MFSTKKQMVGRSNPRTGTRRGWRHIALAAVVGAPTIGIGVFAQAPGSYAAPFDSVCPYLGYDYLTTGTGAVPLSAPDARQVPISGPVDVVVDTDGSMYFTMDNRYFVYRVTPTGALTRIAGSGLFAPSVPGPALSSPLDSPIKLGIDRARRRLYVGTNSGIQSIDLNTGVLSRLAGNGTVGQPVLGSVATASPFQRAFGLDVAANGDLVVAMVTPQTFGVPFGTDVLQIAEATGVITRIAGNGLGVSVPVTGPIATTPLPQSVDVTVTNSGTIFLLTADELMVLNPGGQVGSITAPVGQGTEADGNASGVRLRRVSGLTYDAASNALFLVGGDNALSERGSFVRRVDLSQGTAFPITRYAGTDVQGTGTNGDGLGRTDPNVHFNGPKGVGVAPDGTVVVADTGGGRLRTIAPGPNGIVSTIAGKRPIAGSGSPTSRLDFVLGAPASIAFDATGNAFTADSGARRVWKTTPNGTTSLFAGNGESQPIFDPQPEGPATSVPIGMPNAVAIAPDGTVYIGANSDGYSGDVANNVVKVDTAGNLTRVFGSAIGAFGISADGTIARNTTTGYISDLAVDPSGSLYVSEYASNRVRKIGGDGILRTYATVPTGYSPTALEFDSSGNLFVGASSAVFRVDGRNATIDRVVGSVPATGSSTGFGGPAGLAILETITGVAVNADGELFIADSNFISKVTPTNDPSPVLAYRNATLVRLAGGTGTSLSGGAATATFVEPRDVTIHPTTGALLYPEFAQNNNEQLYSRQIREIASNGCASLRLSTTAGSVLATGNGTALEDLPTSQLPRGGGIYTLAKLRSAPLASIATRPSPLASIPLASIPIAGTPLASIPLASIPLASIAGGWQTLLVGTAFEGIPLQNITLGQVIGISNIASVPLASIDLRNSPLASISVAAIALGSLPLASIPLASIGATPLDQWCTALAAAGFDCVVNGITATSTLLDLELRSAPLASIPLASIPLASIPLASIPLASIPLASIPLASIPLASIPLASIKITGTPLASIPLASIPLASINLVVDCTLINCATGTFATAFAANAFRLGARLGDIEAALSTLTIGQLAPSLPASVTLEDLLIGLISRPDLPWEAASLEQIGLTTSGTLGGSVATYRAGFRLFSTRPAGPVPVTITMPADFTYRPGSAVLNVQQVGLPLASTPLEPTVAGSVLTFQVPAATPAPSDVSIEMSLRSGTGTGTSTVTANVGPVTANAPVATATATVTVVDPNEPNDAAPYPSVAKDRLYIGAISTATDRDNFTLAVPPRGTVTEIFLSHLPIDADLVVYDSNGQQSLRSGVLRPAQTGPTTQIVEPALGTAQQNVEPQTLQDVPIDPTLPLADASARRGTATESVKLVSRGQGGNYTIQISGYNGASSGAPYLFRVRQTLPPGAGSCPPRSFAFAGQGINGTSTAVPSNISTLFLVNQKRLGDTYGAAEAATVLSRLTTLAARPDVNGAILPVETNAEVAAAYSNWDAAPCEVTGPNAIVNAINTLVDATVPPGSATRAALKNIVVVGGDDMIPFARLDDDTNYSNELEYASDVANGAVATPISAALSERKTLSDDPYASFTPSVLSDGKFLYLPSVAIGRLVETPSEINGQVDQYLLPAVNGRLSAGTALTTGYDFLRDGATAVDTGLGARLAAPTRSTLINDVWNKAALLAALFPSGSSPDIASINAHFDHYGALPAVGDSAPGRADLLTTADLASNPNRLVGRLVFSMGCHSGLAVPDAYLGGPSDRSLDWAQALARQRAVYIANTGYGYGDTDVVALSEKLNVELAKRLDGTMTAGQALRFAKHAYAADGITTAYDLKALHQFVYYGLPMFGVGPSPVNPPAPPAALPTANDPATGLVAANVTLNPVFAAVNVTNGASYLTADAKSPLVADGRPIQPRTDVDVTQPNGVVAHGALISALTSSDSTPFTVAMARPVVDLSASEPDVSANDAAFPSMLQNITNFAALSGDRQRLSMAVGQWFPDTDPANATNIGVQRRFTSVSARVFYRPSTDTDFTPPSITKVSGSSSAGTATFEVVANDAAGVSLATVLYRDGLTWRPLTLTGAGPVFTGSGPVAQAVVEYIVQVVDRSGNVAVSSNKASLHVVSSGEPPTGRLKVVPTVCIKKDSDKKIVYRFGYENPNAIVVRIERGNDNRLVGANIGLPRDFVSGIQKKAFEVSLKKDSDTVTWILDGLQATGTRSTSPCPDTSSGNGGSKGDDDDEKGEKERDRQREQRDNAK